MFKIKIQDVRVWDKHNVQGDAGVIGPTDSTDCGAILTAFCVGNRCMAVLQKKQRVGV